MSGYQEFLEVTCHEWRNRHEHGRAARCASSGSRAQIGKSALHLALIEQFDDDSTARKHRELLNEFTAAVKAALKEATNEIAAIDGRLKTCKSCNEKTYQECYASF